MRARAHLTPTRDKNTTRCVLLFLLMGFCADDIFSSVIFHHTRLITNRNNNAWRSIMRARLTEQRPHRPHSCRDTENWQPRGAWRYFTCKKCGRGASSRSVMWFLLFTATVRSTCTLFYERPLEKKRSVCVNFYSWFVIRSCFQSNLKIEWRQQGFA